MRDDLLDAQAAVDWAITQNHVLHKRVDDFINGKPYAVVQEVDPHSRQKITKIAKVTPIPRVIKAETGAIVHSIRSSLDLLATVLAERNGATTTKDVYFPVSISADVFLDDGMKKIKRLSQTDIDIIKSLKPYQGGNDLLYALHQIDVARKHTRLAAVGSNARHFRIGTRLEDGVGGGFFVKPNFAPIEMKEGATLVSAAETADYDVDIAVQIAFREAGAVSGKPVGSTLYQFASLATGIIKLFDGP